MGDVTGPIATLPGARHRLPADAKCDCHPDRPAVARVQGETDSFGCEMVDMCQECVNAEREYERTLDRSGVCDWCHTLKPKLRPARDFDEGMYGRVYDVCAECLKRRDDEIEEELSHYDWFD